MLCIMFGRQWSVLGATYRTRTYRMKCLQRVTALAAASHVLNLSTHVKLISLYLNITNNQKSMMQDTSLPGFIFSPPHSQSVFFTALPSQV